MVQCFPKYFTQYRVNNSLGIFQHILSICILISDPLLYMSIPTGDYILSMYVPIGHVGSPSACNYVKLVDVPEMNYFTSNNQGEVTNLVFYFLLC